MINDFINFYKTRFNKNIVNTLIGINIIVFLIQLLLPENIEIFFLMPMNPDTFIYFPWTILSAMFMHSGFMHIIFNMLWLWSLGGTLLQTLSKKDFLKLYLYGGVGASLVVLLYGYMFGIEGNILGASGAVLVIIYAAIYTVPNQMVNLFGIFKLKMKHLAWGLLAFNLFGLMGDNVGGMIAHLAGSMIGYVYIKYYLKRNILKDLFSF